MVGMTCDISCHTTPCSMKNHDKPPVETTASLTRSQHERLFRMFQIIQKGGYPNAGNFTREFEVTRRTVLRDIDYMRDRLGLPLEYDSKRRGYFFSKPTAHFPAFEITEAELLTLFLAQRALGQFADSALESHIRNSFLRFSELLGGRISVRWNELDRVLSTRNPGAARADADAFNLVSRAVTQKRRLTFHYQKPVSSSPEKRTVEPYHIALVGGQWYIIGRDVRKDSLRTFVLSRMSRLDIRTETFAIPESFDPAALLESGFGVMYDAGETVEVVLEFFPPVSHVIRERVWHPSQKFESLPDKRLLCRMQVSLSRELENWILSWGEFVKVREPKDLLTSIYTRLQSSLSTYESETTLTSNLLA